MALHRAIIEYKEPAWASVEFDADVELDDSEKEEIAIEEFKDLYEEIDDYKVTDLTILNGN